MQLKANILALSALVALGACASEAPLNEPLPAGISEADLKYFGPMATLPECDEYGIEGYSTAEPTTEPDDPSPCRVDGDLIEQVPCGGPDDPICPRRPPWADPDWKPDDTRQ